MTLILVAESLPLTLRYELKKQKDMLFKWGFKYFSVTKQLDYLKEHGIMLGSRLHNNRRIFLYMVKNFFVEVIYKNDSIDMEAEKLNVFGSLNHLNQYLEKEFKSSF